MRRRALKSAAWVGVLTGAALGGSLQVHAQRVAVSLSQFLTMPSRIRVIDLATGATEFDAPGSLGGRRSVFTADGRFALWRYADGFGSWTLQLYDVLTRTVLTLPFDFEPHIAHPRDVAVFGQSGTAAARLDASGLRRLHDCAPAQVRHLDLTTRGDRMAVLCTSGTVAIVDAVTGTVERQLNVGAPLQVPSTHFDATGGRLLVMRSPPAGRAQLALVDVASGQDVLTADHPVIPPPPGGSGVSVTGGCTVDTVSMTRATGVVACSWTVALNPGPMAQTRDTRRLDVSTLTWGPVLQVRYETRGSSLDPEERRLIAPSVGLPSGATVQVIDATTGGAAAEAPFLASGLGVSYAPLAPSVPTVTVFGSSVRLGWTLPPNSPAATGYLLEAGTAPGLSNLGSRTLGPALSLDFPGVPPGRYYVRLRASNHAGTGAASSELLIDVP